MSDMKTFLRGEHAHVRELFHSFKLMPSQKLALEICDELDIHTSMEEEILYPVLKDLSEERYEHSLEEHNEVKPLIERVRNDEGGEAGINATTLEIIDKVEHHIQEEETKDFPVLESGLSGEKLQELGEEMEAYKEEHSI